MTNKTDTTALREKVNRLLSEICPDMKYKGRGANVGVWEMEDMVLLTKPIEDDFWSAKFRLLVFIPNQYGQWIKVEANIICCFEWETMFEGYVNDISDIKHILGTQLGIPLSAHDKKD